MFACGATWETEEIAMFQIIQNVSRAERRGHFLSFLAILALAVSPLSADTIASTLSTQTPPYDPASGDAWLVGLSNNVELAVGFQSPFSSSYLLSQIQVADGFSVSDPNSSSNPALNDLIVGIWQNTTNDPNTATELQSWNITAPGATGGGGQLYTLTSILPTIINPSDFYFITENVTPDGANTAEWGWAENNLTPMQIGFYSGTYGTPGSFSYGDNPCTNPGPCTAANDPSASGTPAYSVSGTQVATPEPRSYAAILCVALLGLAIQRRRRQAAAKV
jgi:hypothetical protein